MRLYALTVPDPDAELVADRCWQAGAEGIWESTAGEGRVTLRVGVEEADVDAFEAALADVGPVDVTATDLVELSTRTVELPAAGGPRRGQAWRNRAWEGDGVGHVAADGGAPISTSRPS